MSHRRFWRAPTVEDRERTCRARVAGNPHPFYVRWNATWECWASASNLSVLMKVDQILSPNTTGNGRPWTPEEKRFLRANVGPMTHQQIADHLGRPLYGVQWKAVEMGLVDTRVSKSLSSRNRRKGGDQ